MNSSETVTQGSWRRSFWSLIVTQFQRAFSDNAYKFLLIFVITASGVAKKDRDTLVLVIGVLFSLPFILFSMAGGFLADRYSKRTVTLGTKIAEVLVMTVALFGLIRDSMPLKLAAVFLLKTDLAFGRWKPTVVRSVRPR